MEFSKHTPNLIAWGCTKGGFTITGGDVVIKTFVPGESIDNEVWDTITSEDNLNIFSSLENALRDLRKKHYIMDCLMRRDIIWDSKLERLYIVDLESCYRCVHEPPPSLDYEMRDLVKSNNRDSNEAWESMAFQTY
ncbi:hypothetical protein ABW19_dt0207058 [Dactylella cylindrospora]|nr:hypothetical protein ABW19_dt0207058 [Dactylella cylindrospora]